ncbi:MAG: hypothetical protein KDI06_04675, partial [Calditrichaeota bacterium]|nr:hypothetical protein [Calditrichota bacterium]
MKKWLWMMFGCLGMLSGTLLGQSGENPHGPLQWECQACHTTSSWNKMRNPMDFRHEETGFALDGRHGDIECYTCHETPDFKAAATECASCHTDVHQAQFGLDCQRCHTPDSWDNQFEVLELHAAQGFPLTGVHTSVDCQACHNSADQREFAGLDVNCYACHMGDYVMTEDPSHKTADFSLDCESCHRPAAVSWQGATYQHSEAFKLSGAHLQADCIGCHQNGYAGTSNDCYTCHQVDYNRVEFPNHAQAGFPTECASCHNEVRWEGAVFDHLQASGFELRGAHATAFCQTCHVGGQVTGLPRDCVGCHQTDFNNTSDPDHVANGFPTECAVCHSENAWEPADFDHNLTDFPLTGSHISVDCIDCHDQGYANTPDDCYSCHQVDFENADDPNHVANNFSHNCLDCHNTTDWDDSDFNHDNTDFPLTGAHIPLDCIS